MALIPRARANAMLRVLELMGECFQHSNTTPHHDVVQGRPHVPTHSHT
jgi:hypothetical protein